MGANRGAFSERLDQDPEPSTFYRGFRYQSMGLPSLKKDFKPELSVDHKEMGRADTLRYNVLTYVVEENYDRAIQELRNFMARDFEFPTFKRRVERYIEHAVDLVNAIRAKRNFPGGQMLTIAKQKELNEIFAVHFHELQHLLKRVEKIQYDVRIEDVRSTVWVVRAAIYSVIVLAIIAFILDGHRGLFETATTVLDDLFQTAAAWLFSKF